MANQIPAGPSAKCSEWNEQLKGTGWKVRIRHGNYQLLLGGQVTAYGRDYVITRSIAMILGGEHE